jgi:AcrR family transcriptional regulator
MPRVVPEYKEKAKGRIVKAGHEIFSKKGYHDTTMDDIADRLGVSKGALYQYFNSKEDLYRAILAARYQGMTEMLPSMPTGSSFSESCQAFFDSLTGDTSSLGLGFEIISEATRNPALAKVVRENYIETTRAIEACLQESRRTGSLRKDLDVHLLTKGLIALYDGLIVALAIGADRSEVRKVFGEFLRAMEEGMLRKTA